MALTIPAAAAMTWGQALPLMAQMAAPSVAGLGVGTYAANKFRQLIRSGGKYNGKGRVVAYKPYKSSYKRSYKRSYRSPRYKSKRRYKRRKFKKSAKSQCRALAKKVNQYTGELLYRARVTSQESSAENVQYVKKYDHNTVTNIENGPLTKLYYYNPSTPGTLLNPDYTDGTYSRELRIQSSGIKLAIRNNSKGTAVMKAYLCYPKADTSVSVGQDWNNRNADNPTTVDTTVIGTSPMDLRPALWGFKLLKKRTLQPGQSCIVKHITGGFNYKPAKTDVHSDTYQRGLKACSIFVVQHGVVSHDDSSTGLVGVGESHLDVEQTQFWRCQYSAGVNIKYTYDANTYSAMATGATQAQKPASSITLASL